MDTSAKRKIGILTLPAFEALPLNEESGMLVLEAACSCNQPFVTRTTQDWFANHVWHCPLGEIVDQERWFDISPKGRVLFKVRYAHVILLSAVVYFSCF